MSKGKFDRKVSYDQFPYDLHVTNEGIHDVWFMQGSRYVRMPALCSVDIEQDPELAVSGLARVRVEFYAACVPTEGKKAKNPDVKA